MPPSCAGAPLVWSIDVRPVPALAAAPYAAFLCPGQLAEQTYAVATPVDTLVYAWTVAGGTIVAQQGGQVTVDWQADAAAYALSVVARTPFGCSSDTLRYGFVYDGTAPVLTRVSVGEQNVETVEINFALQNAQTLPATTLTLKRQTDGGWQAVAELPADQTTYTDTDVAPSGVCLPARGSERLQRYAAHELAAHHPAARAGRRGSGQRRVELERLLDGSPLRGGAGGKRWAVRLFGGGGGGHQLAERPLSCGWFRAGVSGGGLPGGRPFRRPAGVLFGVGGGVRKRFGHSERDRDGRNEFWEIARIEAYAERRVVLYDRWGAEVWRSATYGNEWRGQDAGGAALPSGVYFYRLETERGAYRGWVQVLR